MEISIFEVIEQRDSFRWNRKTHRKRNPSCIFLQKE